MREVPIILWHMSYGRTFDAASGSVCSFWVGKHMERRSLPLVLREKHTEPGLRLVNSEMSDY
jgi:hypothetical protein